jgi:hypothetical protein
VTPTQRCARRASRIMRCVAAFVVVFGPLAAPLPPALADDAASMTIIGTFQPTLTRPGYTSASGAYAAMVGIAPDPSSRSLITLDSGSPAYVAAYDSSTLHPRAGSGRLLDGTVTAELTDPRQPGVWVALASAAFQPATAIEHLQVVGGHVTVTRKIDVSTQLSPRQTVVGMAYDPVTKLLFAVTVVYEAAPGAPSAVAGTVELALIDPNASKVLWHQSLRDCNLPMTPLPSTGHAPIQLSAPLGVVRSPHVVDIGCSAQSPDPGIGLAKLPLPLGVGVVSLKGSGAATTYDAFSLDPYPGDASSIPSGVWIPSVERMAFQFANTNEGSGWAIFDGRHSAFVGTIPLPQAAIQVGGDPVHGRLYLLDAVTSAGLVAADAGVTPADQGHAFPQFAADTLDEDNDLGHLATSGITAVDPAHGNLFILYSQSRKFVVVHDDFPYYSPPPPPDVDSATAGIPEVEGQTAANYSGSAQGYGSIVRQVGGEASLQFNAVPVKVFGSNLRGTRELATSFLTQATLSNSTAQASLIDSLPDKANTQSQLNNNPAKPVSWPYQPAECVDFGSGHRTGEGDGGSVTCDAAAAVVRGKVTGGSSSESMPKSSGAPAIPEVVSIGSSTLEFSSTSTMGKGITTEVQTTASGISILGGMLKIGEVTSDAKATANGQAGGATSSFTRSVNHVTVNGAPVCPTGCNLDTLAAIVNAQLVGHVRIAFPDQDPTVKGSPGGYQAVVRRDPYTQAEQTSLNDQASLRSELPGMEITIYEDNIEPSRTIVYLAAGEAEAHYGVYSLGSGCELCPPPPPPTPGGGGPGGSVTIPGDGSTTQPGGTDNQQPALANGTNIGGAFKHGVEFLLSGLGDAFRQFGVWAILLLPVYLSARRWALANRHGPTSGSA